MKKKFIRTICRSLLALTATVSLLTACSDSEDDLHNSIDFTSPYVIEDNPDDSIQHRCYLLYKEYGVPVYFNDTIKTRVTGKDLQGNDVYTTETIDLNWNFQSHDKKSVTYRYQYITADSAKSKALDFAEDYLSSASSKMRPFCMLLVDSVWRNSSNERYINGFRCLVVSQLSGTTRQERLDLSQTILRKMVLSRVSVNETLVSQFGEVSNRNKYYGRPWVNDGTNGGLGCVWGVVHKGTFWKPYELFNDSIADEYLLYSWQTNVSTVEEFEAERDLIIRQIGKFGFICGDTDYSYQLDHVQSPSTVSQDLTFYVNTILAIGRSKFMERYGASSLVKKKFDILADYIENELLIDLNF